MAADITKYGVTGLQGLQGLNQQPIEDDELQRAIQQRRSIHRGNTGGPSLRDTTSIQSYGYDTPMGQWGSSKYDEQFLNAPQTEDQQQDTRYENQPWYDTLANGIGKMLGTAGTTFVSSIVGLPAGIATAIGEGRWSGLWDNDVTNALGDVDKWLEENMTNYKSTEQQNAPWYSLSNLGSMNFWADDVIKNAGFTLGAAASMAVGSGSLGLLAKSFGFVNDVSKGAGWGNKIASALFSATGEGMIEARNGVEERNKLELKKLEDALAPEKQALDEEFNLINAQYSADGDYNAYKQRMADYAVRRDEFSQKMDLGRQQIEESGRAMGDKILLGNQVLLTAGNIIQFSKLMNKSFNNARHAAEATSKMSKPFLAGAERVSSNLADGYKVTGKGIGRLHAATKGILTEGSEEMNQQWIQNTASYTEQAKDANDYWKAKYDNDAYNNTVEGMYTLGNAISQGFKDSWGDVNQWEQFVIGGLTGMAGSYAPTKLFNQDKTKSRWDPRRYGEWSGGAYNEIGDFNKEYNQYKENVDDLNKVLAQDNFGERTRNLIAHTYFENSKDAALKENDKKTWKDEDDKQAIHDIQAFLRAGKLDDLRAIYNEMGKDMSDEEIEDIVKRSTQEVSAEDNKQQFDAQIDAQIAEKQSRINGLNSQIDALSNSLEGSNPSAREANEAYVHQQIHNLQMQVNSEEDEIEKLQEKKASYSGEKTFISPYLDSKGNRIKTNDEIRDEIKHNTDEMSRKLDSYLDSVNAVNEDTRGVLSKDQEDNLAYLHFLGKEKEVRFKKVMAENRANMPKKFLFKTNKTPEQLTKEYASSNLVFEKNDNTQEGYVEADTSLMDDATFANFFMREIMWGGNISADFGETADEKAAREKESKDSSLSEEERKKRAMERLTAKLKEAEEKHEKEAEEQQVANVKRMKQEFVESYRKNNNATVDEALNAFKKLRQAIIDASDLLNEAGEYNRTLSEYMSNPQKVDEDKKKAEDKAAKETNKQEVKGMTVRDLSNRDDLDELLTQAQNEKDIDLINKIKKAKVLREKRAGLDAAESDSSSYEGLDPADKDAAFQILRQQVENDIDDNDTASDHEATARELADKVADVDEGLISDHIDNHAVVNIDPKTGKKTLSLKKDNINPAEEAKLAQFAAENPEEYEKQRSILVDRIRNAIKPIDDKLHKLLSEINVDDIEDEDTAKMQKYSDQVKEDENLPDIEPEKKNDRNAPVQTVPNKAETPAEKKPVDGIGEEATLTLEMQQGTENGMQTAFDSGQHPWFSVSGRIGYHTNEPYSATLKRLIDDPATSEQKREQYRKQYKRAVAVEKFLDESGAYTRVENGGAQRRGKVKFKVFKSVNDAAEDFVIFICSVNNNGDITGILGDLPSSDADIDPNTEKRTGLAELYEEARKQFDEAGADELVLKGIESEIDFTYIGKPQYQEGRQKVNELFNGKEFTIALKVVDTGSEAPVAFLDTGKKSLQGKIERDAIKDPLTGSLGQPYVLIPTSQANNRNNFKKGYWAVPIATPSFGEIDKNSIFYRTVRQTLEQIRDGKLSETEAKTKLGELFGVANFHVNFDSAESRKGAGIRATTYIRQDGSEKGAPHTLHVGDRASMDVDAILNELGRFFINIANSQINSNKTYSTIDGTAYTYNQMIGEIATTNVAKPHTVNDWFTIKPIEKKGDKWEITKTPTQRIPYPSGGENTIFNISIPYQDGTTHLWTISPRDWTVRDEQGRAIYFNDSVHSDAEANMAAIQMARAFGRYYMKDMSRPYVVQVGNQARLFDPTTNTFKTAKELEETPRYKKGVSFNSLEDEYNYLMSFESDMIEGFAQAAAQKAVQQQSVKQDDKDREDAQARVNASKLLEKNLILDVVNNQNGFEVSLNPKVLSEDYLKANPNAEVLIVERSNKLVVIIQNVENAVPLSESEMQPVIDRFIPKELQDFFKNGGREKEEEAFKKLSEKMRDENPDVKISEIEEAYKNVHDVLRDDFGIPYVNQLVGWGNLKSLKKEQEEAQKEINRERSEATVEKIKEDSKNYVLTDAKGNENPQGAYYKDKRTEQLHARVTSVKEGDSRVQPFNETDAEGNTNPWILPSTTIGNAVDEFVRAFFAGEDVEASPLAQNLSEETKKNLKEDLQKLKDSLGKWKVVSSGIVASGTVMVKDANGDKVAIRVAGTLDLLLYNPEKDEYAIYDMKTHRGAVDSQKELDWAAQLSLYKQLLETKFPELRGKIKALKIVPFSTSGYDALKQHYEKDSEGRLTSNGEVVTVDVKYDGKTIDLTKKEMNLDISFARPGFKKEYVEGEGAQKILVSKPQPKLGEALQVRVKEGFVKTINKIESKDSIKTFLKPSYRDNNEAIKLAETIDKAREDGTLSELCLTQGTMNLLQDMLDTRKIDRIAGFAALAKSGIEAQGDAAPEVEVGEEESIDAIAERKGILNPSTKNAWNRLTDENKEKIVKLKRGTNNIKKELKECQRLGKDPNTVIAGYLHRKADETSGYTLINMKKELSWLDKVLPRLSKENKLRIVEGLIKCSDGTWSYGQMKQGLIYLASNGKEGTVYHEAFHAVTQWILTDQELDSLYEAAKERYGNLDTVTLEEKLADDFMRYTMGFEPSYKKRNLNIFQRLWRAIKDMFKKTSMIDKLYRDINDGVYADRVLRTESNEFAHIDSNDRQVSMKYNFLDNEQKTRLRDNKVSQQQYEVLSAEEKEYLFHCVL